MPKINRDPSGNNHGHSKQSDRSKRSDHSQTLIIPKISPEVLAAARRAAETGTPMPEPEQEPEQKQTAQAEPVQEKTVPPQVPVHPAETAPKRKSLNQAQEELHQNIHDDHLWLNNPVIMRGLGLAPAVVAATDGDNALMLCAAAILLLTATRVLAVMICHLTGNRFRAVIYCYCAALLYIPAYILLYALFGAELAVLGIYLPVLIVEPVIVKRLENSQLEGIGEAFRRGINNTIGFCLILMLMGCLRELLAQGTVFGHVLLHINLLPIASQPAGGFILLGILAAVWTSIARAYINYKEVEVKQLYADRKH